MENVKRSHIIFYWTYPGVQLSKGHFALSGRGVRSANAATSVGRGSQGSERGEEKVRSRVPRPHTTFVNYFFYTHTRAPLFLIKANM